MNIEKHNELNNDEIKNIYNTELYAKMLANRFKIFYNDVEELNKLVHFCRENFSHPWHIQKIPVSNDKTMGFEYILFISHDNDVIFIRDFLISEFR